MHPSQQPPLPAAASDSDDSDRSLSDDDLEFVAEHGRHRLSFLDDLEKEERKARDQLKLAAAAEEKKKKKRKNNGVDDDGSRREQGNAFASSSDGEEEEEDDDDEDEEASDSGSDDDNALRSYERAPRSLLGDESSKGAAAARHGGKGAPGEQEQLRRSSLLPVKTPAGAVLFGDDAVNAALASAEARARRVEGITLIEEEKEEEEAEEEEEGAEEEAGEELAADADDAAASDSDSSGSSGWGSPVVSDDEGDDDDDDDSGDDDDGDEAGPSPSSAAAFAAAPPSSPSFHLLSAEALEAARVRIAALATRVLECPEKRLADLRSLVAEASGAAAASAAASSAESGPRPAAAAAAAIRQQQDPRVTRLAILSAAAVFRDVAPGYRVRPFDEAAASAGASFDGAGGGAAVRLSAEVRALRAFEGGLLSCYGAFLRALLRAADAGRSASSSLARAAEAGRRKGRSDGGEEGEEAHDAAAATARAAAAALSPAAAARRAHKGARGEDSPSNRNFPTPGKKKTIHPVPPPARAPP